MERAFQIARSGNCRHVSDLKEQLRREGLDSYQLEGPMLLRQLRELIETSRKALPTKE